MVGFEKVSFNDGNFTFYLSGYMREKFGIVFCFTNRSGGYSKGRFESLNLGYHTGDNEMDIKRNREKILERLDIASASKIYSAEQVHGSRILDINKEINLEYDNINKKADCLTTDMRNVPIMVMGADCNLILIADTKKKAVAAVHAGWRGTLQGIATSAISYMKDRFKSEKRDMVAAFGPSIRKCCYEVDESLIKKFAEKFDSRDFFEKRGNNFFLDLVKVNRIQLEEAGINRDNIYDSGGCTFCNHSFFSYRRSGITGRQGAIAAIL